MAPPPFPLPSGEGGVRKKAGLGLWRRRWSMSLPWSPKNFAPPTRGSWPEGPEGVSVGSSVAFRDSTAAGSAGRNGPSPFPPPRRGGGSQRYTLVYNSAAPLNPAKAFKLENSAPPLKGSWPHGPEGVIGPKRRWCALPTAVTNGFLQARRHQRRAVPPGPRRLFKPDRR